MPWSEAWEMISTTECTLGGIWINFGGPMDSMHTTKNPKSILWVTKLEVTFLALVGSQCSIRGGCIHYGS